LLALVRHGESQWIAEGRFQGRGDSPLTDLGRLQARAVGMRLASPEAPPSLPLPPDLPAAIHRSPLARAAETARAVADAFGGSVPLLTVDALTELSQGAWEGLTHDEVRLRYPAELEAWRHDPARHHAPGGESLADAAARARVSVATILGPRQAATPSGARLPEPGARMPEPGARPPEPVLGYERRYGEAERSSARDWAIVVAHDGILRLLTLELLGGGLGLFWSIPFALAAVTVLDLSGEHARLRAHNLDEHITALAR
jgi:broad specificity phosphatase PhoE